ncbi:MAG: shikimate kinase AroL [Desulfohalobiaceae bacterium]|nr:shikimate kinase AroL [Desulfohalobiaceae bacterium]
MVKFVKKRVDVEEADYTEVYKPGEEHVPEFRPQETNLFFIGLRGSGKTALAAQVARELGTSFLDTDDLVMERTGLSIAEYVRAHGWEEFRLQEQDCLKEIGAGQGRIVATGGGIVLLPENRRLLKAGGRVFYLQADVGLLAARLRRDPEQSRRPPLSDLSLEEELARTLRQREPLYYECMDYILQAGKSLGELTSDVLTMLRPDKAVFQEDEGLDS